MDQPLFQFLLNDDMDTEQHKAILKTITTNQYKALQHIAIDVLNDKFNLDQGTYERLFPHRRFIRRLSEGDATIRSLVINLLVIKELISLTGNNAVRGQIGFTANRKMGGNKKADELQTKFESNKRSISASSDTEGSVESNGSGCTHSESSGAEGEEENEEEEEEDRQKERSGKKFIE